MKPGYKQTKVGVIPEEWDVKPFSELFDFQNGVNADKASYGQGVPFINVLEPITYSHLHGAEITGQVTLPESLIESYAVQRGDVLFNRTSETQDEVALAATYLGTRRVVFGGFVIRGRPRDQHFDPVYSGYALRAPVIRSQIIPMGQGAIRANVGQHNLGLVVAPVPPLPEQRAIAEALSDVDALVNSLERLIAKKRDLKQAAMQQLLTGQTRLPGFHNQWETKRMSELSWFQEGPGVRNTQFTNSGIKLLNGTNIFRGVLNLDTTTRFISEKEAYGPYAHFLADEGDIVLASSGITVDRLHEKVAFVRRENLPFCMNTSTIRFKPHLEKVNAAFLFQFLISDDFKSQIGGAATGSAQLNFGPSHVAKIRMPFFALPEQIAIAEVLTEMDAELAALEQRREKTRALKQGMMQELLTGRTRLIPSKESHA